MGLHPPHSCQGQEPRRELPLLQSSPSWTHGKLQSGLWQHRHPLAFCPLSSVFGVLFIMAQIRKHPF